MTRVELIGWRKGLKKISLNHLLREFGGKGLAEAKLDVDRLLDGGRVVVECADLEAARSFCEQATSLGADCVSMVQPEAGRGEALSGEGPHHRVGQPQALTRAQTAESRETKACVPSNGMAARDRLLSHRPRTGYNRRASEFCTVDAKEPRDVR